MSTGKYRSRKSASVAQTYSVTDAGTTTAPSVLTLTHFTSGTPAAGFGSAVLFRGENSTGTDGDYDIAKVAGVWATATAGSEVSDVEFYARNAGAALARLVRFKGNALSIQTDPFLFDQNGFAMIGGIGFNGTANRIVGYGSTTDGTGLNFSSATLDLAVMARNSLYLNIDSNNDTTTAALIVACNRASSSGGTPLFEVNELGSTICGPLAVVADAATDGFLYIPTCAGTPSGTPTAKTGKVALVYSTTDNRIYVYDGAWISTLFA